MRLFAVLLLLVALAVPTASAAGVRPVPSPRSDVRHALVVLHSWDERRARAWARSDEAALRGLYLRGSTASRSDVRLLRSYAARGFVVRRLVTQVFGIRVLRSTTNRLVVRVLDRVAGGEVATGDRVLALPSTRPVVRRIVLVRVSGSWKVAAVTR
jgi:hypothetical protein